MTAFGGERTCRGEPDALRCAGDEHRASFELQVHSPLLVSEPHCCAYNFGLSNFRHTSRMPTSSRKRAPANGARVVESQGLAGTRTDRIRQAIERAIVSGKLEPGSKLDENALAARHG